jgi:hypothetical protein
MVAFCELLGWYRRLIERVICSALKLQLFVRLYDELPPTGRKLQPFFVHIDEWSHFASCWTGFDALDSVHYVQRVKCSNLGVYTTKSLQREGNYSNFLSKSTNGRVVRVVGLVSTLNRACTMFCA